MTSPAPTSAPSTRPIAAPVRPRPRHANVSPDSWHVAVATTEPRTSPASGAITSDTQAFVATFDFQGARGGPTRSGSVAPTESFDQEHKANDERHDRQEREDQHDEEDGRRGSVVVTGVAERATLVGRERGREKKTSAKKPLTMTIRPAIIIWRGD
jgi:hypothetical protein